MVVPEPKDPKILIGRALFRGRSGSKRFLEGAEEPYLLAVPHSDNLALPGYRREWLSDQTAWSKSDGKRTSPALSICSVAAFR